MTGEGILRHAKKPETIKRLKKLAAKPDSEIDYSDIPKWTEEQWKNAMKLSDYLAIRHKKESVTARLDKDVVAWLRSKGSGYQTRMNAILREAMAKDLKRAS